MKFFTVKKKIAFLLILILFVFGVFQLVAVVAPSVGRFSAKSALVSAQFSLPNSTNLVSKLNLQQLFRNETNSDYDNLVNVEVDDDAKLFESGESADVIDFEPFISYGPPKVEFSPQELKEFNEKDGPIFRNCYKAGAGKTSVPLFDCKKNLKNEKDVVPRPYAKNLTQLPNSVVEEANKTRPSFTIDGNSDKPQVLIVHTHSTEAYEVKEKKFYSKKSPSHSKNFRKTVIGVSDEIVKQLQEAKIGVIHDKTVHDDPSCTGSYDRSNQTIRNYLAKYPSIKVVLDIHRDGIQNDKNERIAPVTKINGRKAAQIMIISGCDNGTMHFPNYRQNLAFACLLQRQIENDYPSLTRPLLFKYKHYNQSLTPGTLLVEIGSDSNSVDEANFSCWLFGKSLAKALLSLTKK